MSEQNISQIPVNEIQIPDVILRQPKSDDQSFLDMQETIRALGRPNYPILCRRKALENGTPVIELVDGRQRLECCRNLGLATIPVIFETMTDREAIVTQMRLNLVRIEQDPMEVAKALAKAAAMDTNATAASIAKEIGRSTKYVEDRLRLTAIKDENIRKAISAGEITIGNAVALQKAPEAVQAQLVDHAKTQKTEEFAQTVSAAVTKLKEANKANPKPDEPVVYAGPIAARKKLEEIQGAATNSELLAAIISANGCTTLEQAAAAALLWAIDMDAAGKAAQETAWKQRQEEKAAKEAERKAASEAKKQANAALKDNKNPILTQISEEEKALAEKSKKTREQLSAAAIKLQKEGVYPTVGEAVAALNAGKHPDLFSVAK